MSPSLLQRNLSTSPLSAIEGRTSYWRVSPTMSTRKPVSSVTVLRNSEMSSLKMVFSRSWEESSAWRVARGAWRVARGAWQAYGWGHVVRRSRSGAWREARLLRLEACVGRLELAHLRLQCRLGRLAAAAPRRLAAAAEAACL